MTGRERIMLYVLGGLALGGIGYVAYTTFVQPIRESAAKVADLNDTIDTRELDLLTDEKNNRRIQTVLPLTLPANRELAEAEYEALLVRLFSDSKISGGKYAKQTSSISDPEPELVPGVPGRPGKKAYTKVIYKIEFEKVTLAKLAAFVERYHKVPLMQQLVSCNVKHSSAGTGSLKQKADERADLNVTLISEAVLMDGAPDRKTLFAVPDVFGAALGVPALHGLRQDTEKVRYLTPTPDVAYYPLADPKRNYELIAARDAFHGPLPPPPSEPSGPGEKPPPPPPPPPYDSSPYTYLNSLVQTTQGSTRTATAEIRDRYYEQYYTIRLSQIGNLFEVKVERSAKEWRTNEKTREVTTEIRLDRGHPRSGGLMELSDRVGKEIRTFKVYGLYGNALLLGEKEKVKETPKDDRAKGGGRPQKGAKAPPVVLPRPDPRMAAIGGMGGIVLPKETFYLWEVNSQQSLAQMKKLSDKEAKAALAVATLGLKDEPAPRPLLEEAPMPKPVQVLTSR